MFGKIKTTIILALLATVAGCAVQKDKNKRLTDYVNPFIGTTTLWDSIDLGYNPTRRAWGAETFPGSSLYFSSYNIHHIRYNLCTRFIIQTIEYWRMYS